ncbi:Protein srek1IP1 [Gonapodya sp. JEL0774]|nr:Protein srek1IP1 [Gonapodya sp. JEL0774]
MPPSLWYSIQVANVSSLVSESLLRSLFQYLGDVKSLSLSPSPLSSSIQEGTVEFNSSASATAALHLTGTEFGDRTLMVTTITSEPPTLPAAIRGVKSVGSSLQPGGYLGVSLVDPAKADAISRTVYVGNVATAASEEELLAVFENCGAVTASKVAGDPSKDTRFAFVEFGDLVIVALPSLASLRILVSALRFGLLCNTHSYVSYGPRTLNPPTRRPRTTATREGTEAALRLNGVILQERSLKISQSKNAISRPVPPRSAHSPGPSNGATSSAVEREAAIKARLREAQERIGRKYGDGGGNSRCKRAEDRYFVDIDETEDVIQIVQTALLAPGAPLLEHAGAVDLDHPLELGPGPGLLAQ